MNILRPGCAALGNTKTFVMKKLPLIAGLLAASSTAFAQGLLDTGVSLGSNFFVALVCGVIIAFAMQYLLTALSVAIGISAAPNLKEKYAEAKARDPKADNGKRDWNEFKHEADDTPTGVKISSAVGLWNMLTTAIALFTGTALAMKMVPWFAETPGTATTLALTIWGTFFMLLFWLESRFASTLVGGIISTATSGLKSVAQGVVDLVKPSPVSQVEDLATATIDKLESSFGGSFDTDRIVGAIENFGSDVSSTINDSVPSYDRLVSDLKGIMNESSKKSGSNPAKWTAIQSLIQTAIESGNNSGSSKGKTKGRQLQQVLAELKSNYDSTGSAAGAAKKTAKDNTSFDDAKIDEYVSQIEKTLQESAEKQVGGQDLGKQLDSIISNGGGSVKGLKERLGSMDRKQVAALVANNTSLTEEQVNSYVDQAVSAVSTIREKLQDDEQLDVISTVEETTGVDLQPYVDQAQALIARFIESDDAPQGGGSLDLAGIKREVMRAMSNPNDTLTSVRQRLSNFDADSIVAALPVSANSTAEARADLTRTLNEAKGELERKIDELETSALGTYRQAERRAVIEAEHARKSAASAAWWLVLSIVVSGVAAMGGALLS